VVLAVVLVERPRPAHPQVGACDQEAELVAELELRLDGDVDDDVQDPQERLPGGLGSGVGVPQRSPEAWGPSPPRAGGPPQLLEGAGTGMECAVGQDDHVEGGAVSGAGQQHLGRRVDREAVDVEGRRDGLGPDDDQASPSRAGIGTSNAGLDREPRR